MLPPPFQGFIWQGGLKGMPFTILRRRVMKSYRSAARFLPALFPFLGGLLIFAIVGTSLPERVSGADEKKQIREEKWKTPSSSAAGNSHVEVRFTDNSVLKLKL